jgi:hypothetical protein
MVFEERSKEEEAARERALVATLREFVENSDLSFYKIASRIGTSGGILSLWLAGTASPRAEELAAIENSFRPEKYAARLLLRARNLGGGACC